MNSDSELKVVSCDKDDDETERDSKGKKGTYTLKGTYIEDSNKRSNHFCTKRKRISKALWEIGAETGAYGYVYLRSYCSCVYCLLR